MKPVINAAYCKKLQSQIKSVIQNFGKYIQLWISDSVQIGFLLNELVNLHSEWSAVLVNSENYASYRLISGDLMIEMEHIFGQIRMFE